MTRPFYSRLTLSSFALALLASPSACVAGNVDGAADPGNGEESVESKSDAVYSPVAAERVIPIRYVVIDDAGETCPTHVLDSAIYEGNRIANRSWLATGIQFSVAQIDRMTMDHFANINGIAIPYWAVSAELGQLYPYAGIGNNPWAWKSNEEWLQVVANGLPHNQITVFVPCTEPGDRDNGHACFPGDTNAHVLHIPAHKAGTDVLSHELGHYFGLPHTFEEGSDEGFDHFYGADGLTRKYFSSAAELTAWRAAGKETHRKDEPQWTSSRRACATTADCPSGETCGSDSTCYAPARCSIVDGTTWEMECNFSGNVYRTGTSPDALRGMSQRVEGAAIQYATNTMAYYGAPVTTLSTSQVNRVRNTLRSTTGLRNQLGRGSLRLGPKRSSTLDFDGDGKRDIAFYRPETNTCTVRGSRDGVLRNIVIPGADPSRGEIPVPGDYDGDGKTDCAVYRPGTVTESSRWLWAASGSGYAGGQSDFGMRGDIPIADVKLRASAGFGRYAVYRPSTGQVWWWQAAGNARWVSFSADAGDELMFADYDRDGYTDLAAWNPKIGATAQARLNVSYSAANYVSVTMFPFGLETDVPVGPLQRDAVGDLDFAVWRPSNGRWYYLLNPRANGTSGYLEQQWGLTGDQPIVGWDFDGDGIDDEAIYRSKLPTSEFWIRKSRTNSHVSIAFGLPGDAPFMGPDRNGDGQPELFLFRPSGTPTARHFEALSSGGTYPTYNSVNTPQTFTDIEL